MSVSTASQFWYQRRARSDETPARNLNGPTSLNIEGPNERELARSPGERVRTLAARIGDQALAEWCARLINGAAYDDPARPSLAWLGGGHAAQLMRRRGFEVRGQDYWPRVWGARALLYVWSSAAEAAVLHGLHDPAWRVREMCAKIVRRRGITEAQPILDRLLDDPVARVRIAAEAALTESARSQESRTPRSSPARPRRQ
jgi:hypothetical protein